MRLSSSFPAILVSLAAMSAMACAAPADEPEASTASAVTTTESGDWTLRLWKGHVETHVGSQWEKTPVDRRFDADSHSRVRFEIDSEGSGRMVGVRSCTLQIPETTIPPGRAASLAGATFGALASLFKLFSVSVLACSPGEEKTETTWLSPRKNFFGWPDPHLNANLGVLGETEDGKSAERDCAALGSVRWVNVGFDGTVACVGHLDSETLRMIVQRPTEIYVQRLTLTRIR